MPAVARIATWNLLHGLSLRDGTARPEALAEAAAALAADVVGLQEVDRRQPRSGEVDQTAVVADALGATTWRFVPVLHGTPGTSVHWRPAQEDDGQLTEGPTYGIGLVSRWPVRRWDVLRFPAARGRLPLLIPAQPRPRVIRVPDEPRAALAAVVDGPSGTFSVVTAHLSFVPGVNARQLRAIHRWAAPLPRPLLLIGDLNLPGALPRRLTGLTQLARAATYPAPRPRVQFDHVLADGVPETAVRAEHVLSLAVSDHAALAVDLVL